ncbi:MAG: peptidylprolyl isomerase, partial [Flavobacteriaceae bacterium]|nr:peptidylprolyl isomerase [Flavobacteriaceae bacterium]
MAILNSIRKRGIFLIIIIAMALFAFILSDVLTKSGSVKGQEVAATINGEDISRIEFMEKVEATQKNFGPNGTTSQAMNTVWEREVRRVLQQQEFEKLGITASDEQVKESMRLALSNNPTFQNDQGVYDEYLVDQYVASVRTSNPQAYNQWLDFVESNKTNIAQTTYYNLIKAGLRSTLLEGERQYRFENDKINIEYFQVPYSSIPDEEFPIGNDEIQKYMNDHKEEFKADAQADIRFVTFTEEPTEEDILGYRSEVLKYLDDRVEYNNVTNANDTLLGLRNTRNYEEFVNTNSDVAFNPNWLFKDRLPVSIADTLFALNEGDIYGPYQLDDTYAISKVVGVRRMADTAEARHILVRYAGLQTAPQDITRTKEAAKKLADSLSSVLNK